MYVCMYVCMNESPVYISAFFFCVHMQICIHVYIYIYICIYIYIYIYIDTHRYQLRPIRIIVYIHTDTKMYDSDTSIKAYIHTETL
jgi:hypothetical protein